MQAGIVLSSVMLPGTATILTLPIPAPAPPLAHVRRCRIEAAIEKLIELLDATDGDADLELDGDEGEDVDGDYSDFDYAVMVGSAPPGASDDDEDEESAVCDLHNMNWWLEKLA